MKILRLRPAAQTLAGLVGIVGLATVVASPTATAAAPTTGIRPATLDKGPAGLVPHVDGSDLVVGESRFAFDGREVYFLGQSGDDHVVGTFRQGRPKSHRVVRVTPDDHRTVVLQGVSVPEISLSADGEQLFRPRFRYQEQRTVMRVWSAQDGSAVASRGFRGYVFVLDADEGRAVLSASSPNRTFWWNTHSDTTQRISDRNGYFADIRNDRLAVLTGDPYDGGCSVVSTLADAGDRIWRSCDQAVLDVSPNGERMTTVYLLSDGLGPGEFQLRKAGGRLLRTYTTYFFGRVLWESDDTLLMLAHGKEKSAWVRCDEAGVCERTSRLRATDV